MPKEQTASARPASRCRFSIVSFYSTEKLAEHVEANGRTQTMRTFLAVVSISAGIALAQDGKVRVFVTDSVSWETSGGFTGVSSDGAGAIVGGGSGGARPQTVEIMKTFGVRCPQVTVTINRERADFIVILEHEGGKELVRKDNKVAVFAKDGDMIHSGSTRSLGNSVKDACDVIRKATHKLPQN